MADGAQSTGFPLQGLLGLVLAAHPEHGRWDVSEDDFWCRVRPDDTPSRVQGWKLHVSATPLSAPEVLHRAAEVLIRHRCAFKFAARAELVLELTGTRYNRAQCGKFITAYPADDGFRGTIEGSRCRGNLPGAAREGDAMQSDYLCQ